MRHPAPGESTERFIADAVVAALADAGIHRDEVDGFAVSSFSLAPDHAIDLAWKLGMTVRWLAEDTCGGASGINMVQHAARAIDAGDAELVVVAAGDRMDKREFQAMVDSYNRVTRDYLAALPLGGPNALFAFLTDRYARQRGLAREDFACIPLAQRAWASRNPGAVYRAALTLEEYLAAPPVAPPLTRYDCVPVVSGADALVLASAQRAADLGGPSVGIRALRTLYNPDHQEGDGIHTGFAAIAPELWAAADAGPQDIDAAFIYDDYPVMVLVQLEELGLIPDGDLRRHLHERILRQAWPLNTSGGQLSAGQAGAAGGLHGLVEAVGQLRGRAGERQIQARLALVTGYGMVLYTHGASHGAAVLERVV